MASLLDIGCWGGLVGLSHASFHLLNFLYKGGDITYTADLSPDKFLSSYWIASTPSVQPQKPELEQIALAEVHGRAVKGDMEGSVETEFVPARPNASQEVDLYYAMNRFGLKAQGTYRVTQDSTYLFQVRLKLTYEFFDTYDWHKGLPAGGNTSISQ